MLKETPEKHLIQNFSLPTPKLVVAIMLPDGTISLDSSQSYDLWNNGGLLDRDPKLLTVQHGMDLLQLLTNELGLVSVDEKGFLQHRIVLELDPHKTTMRILGKIAEALIVDECNKDSIKNTKWANAARRYISPQKSYDKYKALGTGLKYTQLNHPQKYNPGDTQRDIIWIDKDDEKSQLMMSISGNQLSGIQAGLQTKVSYGDYVKPSTLAKYEIPVVYFDLKDNFMSLVMKTNYSNIDSTNGLDYHRGRNISLEIHEKLKDYYHLIFRIISGKTDINTLAHNKEVLEAFIKDQKEIAGKQIVTL